MDGVNISFDSTRETRNLGVFLLREPSGEAWALMALSGVLGGIAHIGVINAIQLAPVSAIAICTGVRPATPRPVVPEARSLVHATNCS